MPRSIERKLYNDTRVLMASVDTMYSTLEEFETQLSNLYERLEKLKNASIDITNTLYAHKLPRDLIEKYDIWLNGGGIENEWVYSQG